MTNIPTPEEILSQRDDYRFEESVTALSRMLRKHYIGKRIRLRVKATNDAAARKIISDFALKGWHGLFLQLNSFDSARAQTCFDFYHLPFPHDQHYPEPGQEFDEFGPVNAGDAQPEKEEA